MMMMNYSVKDQWIYAAIPYMPLWRAKTKMYVSIRWGKNASHSVRVGIRG